MVILVMTMTVLFQINEHKDENERMRVRLRELEAQTLQLIEEKKSLEINLDEVKQQLEAAAEVATTASVTSAAVEADQVSLLSPNILNLSST